MSPDILEQMRRQVGVKRLVQTLAVMFGRVPKSRTRPREQSPREGVQRHWKT